MKNPARGPPGASVDAALDNLGTLRRLRQQLPSRADIGDRPRVAAVEDHVDKAAGRRNGTFTLAKTRHRRVAREWGIVEVDRGEIRRRDNRRQLRAGRRVRVERGAAATLRLGRRAHAGLHLGLRQADQLGASGGDGYFRRRGTRHHGQQNDARDKPDAHQTPPTATGRFR